VSPLLADKFLAVSNLQYAPHGINQVIVPLKGNEKVRD
jgi:hypothetical protein